MNLTRKGAYGADDDIVDFILGITFEIWEQRGVDLIAQYYAKDSVIYGLDGITHGAEKITQATQATLEAFPGRLLLAENVIWSGSREDGYYTSHRLLSLMTNSGPTVYGPATGARVRMTNIADCVVEDGVIVREWLIRDNMTLATQLGAEPVAAAQSMAERRSPELLAWLDQETQRVRRASAAQITASPVAPREDPEAFARQAIASCWQGDWTTFESMHAPYNVLHRSPLRHYSGRDDVFAYYQRLRKTLGDVRFSVDHVASQLFGNNGIDIAVRWTVSGYHDGETYGVAPTGRPLLIMGVTHWRCIAGRIAIESTIFDDLAVLSQALA